MRQTQRNRETIASRRTSHREGAALSEEHSSYMELVTTVIHTIIMIKFIAAAVLDLSVVTTQSLSYQMLVRNWI